MSSYFFPEGDVPHLLPEIPGLQLVPSLLGLYSTAAPSAPSLTELSSSCSKSALLSSYRSNLFTHKGLPLLSGDSVLLPGSCLVPLTTVTGTKQKIFLTEI